MVIIDQAGRPNLAVESDQGAPGFAQVLEWGHRLAETDVGVPEGSIKQLWEAKGWKQFVSHLPDPNKRAVSAIMLENCRRRFGRLDEVTRTSALGTFDKWIFPIIANMQENDVIDQLVSVQPMAGPVSQVVYMDIVTERAKGAVPAGTPMWRALQGPVDRFNDGDELVEAESLGSTDGDGALSTTLAWTPVRAGVLEVTVSTSVARDDGNGSIVASGVITGGTINYATGALTLTTTAATTAATANYVFNSEGNANIQGYELKLSSTPVTAKVLKLRALWSEEADQNLQAMYNIKMESTLITALTNGLQYQKHRQVIYDLRNRADAGVVTWDATPPTGVSYQTHKFSAFDAFVTGGNMIFAATNMATGNWIVTGLQMATVIETLPQFSPRGNRTKMQGITYIGDLGNFKVFADPHYPLNEWLIGYKGDQFLTTGYVLAEYQKLYTTPDVMLTDFLHRRGFATSFAKKLVNSKMFCRGLTLNAPVSYGPVIG
jgi:hypothetical protein